jgi:F-type H+-transporting ATPase subunit delta
MISTKQARRDGKQLFRGCMVNGRLDEARALRVVQAVTDSKPRGWLPALHHFQRLVKLELERRTARVESPVPLEPVLRQDVTRGLERLYGPGLRCEFRENQALLGGLRVQVGSDVYDGSVRSRLSALEASF